MHNHVERSTFVLGLCSLCSPRCFARCLLPPLHCMEQGPAAPSWHCACPAVLCSRDDRTAKEDTGSSSPQSEQVVALGSKGCLRVEVLQHVLCSWLNQKKCQLVPLSSPFLKKDHNWFAPFVVKGNFNFKEGKMFTVRRP